jgi:primosomal protein N' (replication factor Y)
MSYTALLAAVAAGPDGTGELIVQTFAPEHPVMRAIATGDETAFWDEEWRLREAVQLPPVCHLVQIDCWGGSSETAAAAAKRLASRLRRAIKGMGSVAGPLTAPPLPARGRGRRIAHRVLVRVPGSVEPVVARVRAASSRGRLGRGVRIRLDVDPV